MTPRMVPSSLKSLSEMREFVDKLSMSEDTYERKSELASGILIGAMRNCITEAEINPRAKGAFARDISLLVERYIKLIGADRPQDVDRMITNLSGLDASQTIKELVVLRSKGKINSTQYKDILEGVTVTHRLELDQALKEFVSREEDKARGAEELDSCYVVESLDIEEEPL